jgi:hypothetical protein
MVLHGLSGLSSPETETTILGGRAQQRCQLFSVNWIVLQ